MVYKYSLKKDGNKNISKHFKIKEFACKDRTDEILIDYKLIPIIERFRQYVETSVPLNSAYRTIRYNNQIGGAINSYHTRGQALDIPFKQYYKYLTNIDLMCAFFNTLKVKGIIKYNWGIHIDTRINEYHATNTGVRQEYKKINIPLYKNLSIGMENNDVGIVQFILSQFGYRIQIDCKFGEETKKFVKEFQKIKGLKADGIVGYLTWNNLLK